jgi:hypothetical protein
MVIVLPFRAEGPRKVKGTVGVFEGYPNRKPSLTCMFAGGRYWVRTSDLFGVNEARYHCANRPRNHRVPGKASARGGDRRTWGATDTDAGARVHA